jgi:amphi-Trp domain-containing protein
MKKSNRGRVVRSLSLSVSLSVIVKREKGNTSMAIQPERDVEKHYPKADFVAKLRRLADAIDKGEQFEIQIDGERIYVPVRATYSIEHEKSDGGEEVEFQIKWSQE